MRENYPIGTDSVLERYANCNPISTSKSGIKSCKSSYYKKTITILENRINIAYTFCYNLFTLNSLEANCKKYE